MIKLIVKKMLPDFLHPIAKAIYTTIAYRTKPRVTTRQYETYNVLQCCIAYNKSGGYCVPLSSSHRPAAQKILAGVVYEPRTIDFLTSHCNDGDIVHAGTYFGDFLPALSRSRTNDAKIWAFEPNLENYRCALITTYINDLQNVELMNAGLGERKDSVSMMTKDKDGQSLGGASRILDQETENKSPYLETVEIVSVDEIVPASRNVSIIQLDVEGHEKQALTGALKTIQRCRPIIILETLPESGWFAETILKLGYRVIQEIPHNTILAPKDA